MPDRSQDGAPDRAAAAADPQGADLQPPLRAALLGYGLAGRVLHRPLLQGCPGLDLTHVVTSDPGRRAQAARELPAARLLAHPEQLWSRADEFDVVVVASGNLAHVPAATAALELGKATVVDKPLALTAGQARQLCRLASERAALLTVFHNRRWDSDTLTARRLLERGSLGQLLRLESRFTRYRPRVADRWREDPAAGGGVLLDLGSHLVDQVLHLIGPAVEVYAEIDRRRVGARAEDDCFLAVTHAGGVRSHLWCSMTAPWGGPRLVLQGAAGGWAKHDLDGQEAALREGRPAGPVPEPDGRWWDAQGERPEPSVPGDWSAFYRDLVAAVRGHGGVPVPPQAAVDALQVLEAAHQSARTRTVVAVPA